MTTTHDLTSQTTGAAAPSSTVPAASWAAAGTNGDEGSAHPASQHVAAGQPEGGVRSGGGRVRLVVSGEDI
jgi:hypothetical protein